MNVNSVNSRSAPRPFAVGRLITLAASLAAAVVCAIGAPAANAALTVTSFTASTTSTVAGAHSDGTVSLSFQTTLDSESGVIPTGGDANDITIKLPPGLVGIAQNVPQCPVTTFRAIGGSTQGAEPGCPADTQIGAGTAYLTNPVGDGFGYTEPMQIYNLATSPSQAVVVGLQVDVALPSYGQELVTATVHATDDYAVTLSAPEIPRPFGATLLGSSMTLWAVPSDPSHDPQRACEQIGAGGQGMVTFGCSSDAPRLPFVENPTDCSTAPVTTFSINTIEEPDVFTTGSFTAPNPTNCGTVPFAPVLSVTPDSTQAGAPTGFGADLSIPQNNDPYGQGSSELKDTVVTLPPGLVISPSAASNGLEGCSDSQFGAGSDEPATCPAASQIGTVEVLTPLLSAPLTGKLYLGVPLNNDPESGEMFRIFVEFKGFGQDVKLVSGVVADPVTGQLTGRFLNLPELPFNEVRLHFNGGQNAVLMNPSTCGPNTTTSVFTPYSGNPPATNSSTFQTSYDGNGAPCPASLPFTPSASISPGSGQAGASSPLTVSFSREDGTQPLGQITAHLPAGVLGNVASVAVCDPADAAAGTCPAVSRVGVVSATAGPGSDPLTVPGTAYLAYGTDGYPFALSVVVPAVAGPYNLGNVIVLVNIRVNNDGSLTAISNPLPSIIDGVPLDVRSVTLTFDRPGFMLNPTNCGPLSMGAQITSLGGTVAGVSAPFQVSGCGNLPFKPSFTVATQGATSKVGGASLTVRYTQQPGEAATHSLRVELPKQLPSRLTTLQKACPENVFFTNPAACDPGSVVGSAIAHTPILDSTLSGPAYFVSHGGAKFPELIIVLQGEGITIELAGETFISKMGITSSTFPAIPDVPISGFELTLPEGPHSALAANSKLCTSKLLMPTTITGQNGVLLKQSTRISVTGCAKAKPTKKKKTKKGRKKAKNAIVARTTDSHAGQGRSKL
jgi:hypothetical protein